MGTVCSTNGEDAVHSQFKIATVPTCTACHRPALARDRAADNGIPKDGQADAELDAHALEAALREHHLSLRLFVGDWVESQERLLSLWTKREVDGVGASCDYPRSNMEVSSVNNGKKPFGKSLHTRSLLSSSSYLEQELTPVVADPEIPAVPMHPTELPTRLKTETQSPCNRRTQLFMEREAAFGMDAMVEQDNRLARVFHCMRWISTLFTDLNATLQRRFPCTLCTRIDESSAFNTICGMVIFFNAIIMAVAADYEMANFQETGNEALRYIDIAFVLIYTVELAIRIMSKKLAFFQVAWNLFDFAIVTVGWVEVVSFYCQSLTQLRILRFLKMMKVMRVLRVMRSLREVRLLLHSLMGSIKALFWTILIITGMNFMFGIFFVQSLTQARRDMWSAGASGDGQLDTVVEPWTSVMEAMYTLLKASTGGVSWAEIAEPLRHLGWQTFSMFLLYMTLFMFVILNAVTAVFVSSTEEMAGKESETELNKQLLMKEQYVKQVFTLYQDMVGDKTGRGEVPKSVLLDYIDDPRMISFSSSLEIERTDLMQFIEVLSSKGEHGVDLDTFVDGCIRLRGAAKSLDVYDLLIHQHSLAKEVECIR
eukprot:CAMPEP_0172823288 /NCGR_PEP_ID=MMETSP1075-20121228/17224_1 /TAXON_ID=2916 /ORGANISM="Ceratium fusus, Strain PA161109" /LENGTH=596 /DNA_ID=CAMNT_0013664399 /DNA_START=77 /DNA_END=1864 /DNA_ORIENTATION=-